VTDQEVSVSVPAQAQQHTMNGRSFRVRCSDLAWRRAGDEVVVLNLATSSYHALNATGAVLWERLDGWKTAGELAAVLASSFGLTPAAADRDVAGFLAGCTAAGLLETPATH
jgi:hypothetical protein